jgi:hypothetical protein
MDNFTSGSVGASIVIALGILYKIYTAVNHHRIRSRCCGKEIEASIDVDETTPKTNPMIGRDGTADRADSERNQQENRPPTG